MARYRVPVDDRLILPAQVCLPGDREQVLRLLHRTVPPPVSIQLLIDTGSARCSLLPSVLARLNPRLVGTARLETSLAAAEASLFLVRLKFPHTKLAAIPEFVVARAPLPRSLSAFHGVIGRDLLGRWESFHYQGRRGWLTIRDTPGWLWRWVSAG
jgi:hypothetical protein